ncbi:ankyrin 2,3/unc44 [Pelomyxa schiedti]|nr:ankyrin 2,3/unc44 [Pelomyxa schiedti]
MGLDFTLDDVADPVLRRFVFGNAARGAPGLALITGNINAKLPPDSEEPSDKEQEDDVTPTASPSDITPFSKRFLTGSMPFSPYRATATHFHNFNFNPSMPTFSKYVPMSKSTLASNMLNVSPLPSPLPSPPASRSPSRSPSPHKIHLPTPTKATTSITSTPPSQPQTVSPPRTPELTSPDSAAEPAKSPDAQPFTATTTTTTTTTTTSVTACEHPTSLALPLPAPASHERRKKFRVREAGNPPVQNDDGSEPITGCIDSGQQDDLNDGAILVPSSSEDTVKPVSYTDNGSVMDKLFQAAGDGDYSTLSHILGSNPNFLHSRHPKIPGSPTLLFAASEGGHTNIVDFLIDLLESQVHTDGSSEILENSAPPNTVDSNTPTTSERKGATPLHIASWYGYIHIVDILLSKGRANPNCTLQLNNATPLFFACQNGHTSVAVSLINAGANPNAIVTTDDNTQSKENGTSPLYVACQNRHCACVDVLLSTCVDVNLGNLRDGASPLFVASQKGYTEIVDLLLKKGNPSLDVSKTRKDGISPVAIASCNNHVGVVSLLVESGVSGASCGIGACGMTPLHVAAVRGCAAVVDVLVCVGGGAAVPNIVDGTLPLHVACARGTTDVVVQLLVCGGKGMRTPGAQTALRIACRCSSLAVVNALVESGIDMNTAPLMMSQCENGKTPLIIALLERNKFLCIREHGLTVFTSHTQLNTVMKRACTPPLWCAGCGLWGAASGTPFMACVLCPSFFLCSDCCVRQRNKMITKKPDDEALEIARFLLSAGAMFPECWRERVEHVLGGKKFMESLLQLIYVVGVVSCGNVKRKFDLAISSVNELVYKLCEILKVDNKVANALIYEDTTKLFVPLSTRNQIKPTMIIQIQPDPQKQLSLYQHQVQQSLQPGEVPISVTPNNHEFDLKHYTALASHQVTIATHVAEVSKFEVAAAQLDIAAARAEAELAKRMLETTRAELETVRRDLEREKQRGLGLERDRLRVRRKTPALLPLLLEGESLFSSKNSTYHAVKNEELNNHNSHGDPDPEAEPDAQPLLIPLSEEPLTTTTSTSSEALFINDQQDQLLVESQHGSPLEPLTIDTDDAYLADKQ